MLIPFSSADRDLQPWQAKQMSFRTDVKRIREIGIRIPISAHENVAIGGGDASSNLIIITKNVPDSSFVASNFRSWCKLGQDFKI